MEHQQTDQYVHYRIPEGKEKKQRGREMIWIPKNFPNLRKVKKKSLQVRKIQRIPHRDTL